MKFYSKLFLVFALLCTMWTVKGLSVEEKDLILNKFMDKPAKELFKVYHLINQKTYELDSEEGLNRYKIFKQTLKFIKTENKKIGKQVYGLTDFADMSGEEFRSKYLMKEFALPKIEGAIQAKVPESFVTEDVNIDWRDKMNPAKDQKSCGSCWAFAAVASVEGNYNIQEGTLYNLAEQYLVDCSSSDNGCNGGYPTRTFPWLMVNGLKLQTEAPYQAAVSFCSSKLKSGAKNLVKNYESCNSCQLTQWLDILSRGPMVVSMDASGDDFKNYKPANNEWWNPSSCSKENHAITAVGATVENGKVILIVRNSWGENWGIKGYFRVPATNSCLIVNNAWRAITQKEGQPLPPKPDCPTFYSECDYTGKSFQTCDGVADFTAVPGFNATAKSAKVVRDADKWNWYSFKTAKCAGTKSYLGEGVQCSTKNYPYIEINSVASRAEKRMMCATFFEDTCFGGDTVEICGGIPDLAKVGLSLKAKSLYMRDYFVWGIAVFQELNYKGVGQFFSGDEYLDISTNTQFQDALSKAKSIRVFGKMN